MRSKRKAKVPEARSARKVAKLNASHRMIKDYMRADGVLLFAPKAFPLPKRFLILRKQNQQRTAGRNNPAIGLIQFVGDRFVRLCRRGNGDFRSCRHGESFN